MAARRPRSVEPLAQRHRVLARRAEEVSYLGHRYRPLLFDPCADPRPRVARLAPGQKEVADPNQLARAVQRIDGCHAKPVARGLCGKHYMRVRRQGSAEKTGEGPVNLGSAVP